jgi:hypothetical protein
MKEDESVMQLLSGVVTSPIARHVWLVVGLIIAILAALWSFSDLSQDLAERLKPSDVHVRAVDEAKVWLADSGASQHEKARLSQQLDEITARRRHHWDTMSFFYKNYFLSLTMAMLTGIAAAACLGAITKKGWGGTHPSVHTSFIVLSGAAAIFALEPALFKQEQNIADNKSLYLSYAALQNEALSVLATWTTDNSAQVTACELIHLLDSRLARLNNIAIGFDSSRLPTAAPLPSTQQ